MLKRIDPDHDGDDDAKAAPGNDEIDDDQLLAILKAEEFDATSYYTSELAKDQADAMDRYYAAPYGNEVDGRSKITTHDAEDTINWMMPDLMRVIFGGDGLVSCTPQSAKDVEHLDMAAQFLEHVLLEDNPGITIVHDFVFDGLLQRLGVVSVMWEDPQPKPPELLEGVGVEQLQEILNDQEYEILEQEEVAPEKPAQPQLAAPQQPVPNQGQPPPMPAPDPATMPTYNLKVKRTPKMGRVKIENVPPEEIALSRRARAFPSRKGGTSQSAGYVRRKQQRYLADVKRLFPDSAAELDEMKADNVNHADDMDTDPRTLTRFQNESISVGTETSNHQLRKRVDLYTEYLWIDYDNDGIVELRRIVRVGDVICENLAVDDCEFKSWSPIRVAHKAIGRSVVDTIADLQKIRTTMMRIMLDGLSQSLVPRNAVNTAMVDEQGIDDLLDAEVGGVVRCRGDVRQAIGPLTNPDVSAPALQALEYLDQKAEQQSGVTRHAQGISPDAITKTASGIDMLQSAAGERIELVGRWLGLALEEILTRALQLVVAHQNAARWVEIKGKPLQVDPRMWSDEMGVKVHVGRAGASRDKRIINLGTIAQKQEQAILQGGPDNPVCNVSHLINTYSSLTQEMGFKDPAKFWNTPDAAAAKLAEAAQQPKSDPKMEEVKAKAAAATAELQQRGQFAAQELQQKTAATQADQQARAQADAAKSAADVQAAREKMQAEMILKREQMAMERDLKLQQMQAEGELAVWQARQEIRLREMEMANTHEHNMKMASMKPKADKLGNGVRMGGEVG